MVSFRLITDDGFNRIYEIPWKKDRWFVETKLGDPVENARRDAVLFGFLKSVGIPTSFDEYDPNINSGLIEKKCRMVTVVWAPTRLATPDFVERHPNVKKGTRFPTLQVETFPLCATSNRTIWSHENIRHAIFPINYLGEVNSEIMNNLARLVFEVMERVFQGINRSLERIEVHFGETEAEEIIVTRISGYPREEMGIEELLKSLVSENRPPQSKSAPSIAIFFDSSLGQEPFAFEIIKSLNKNWGIFKIAKITCSVDGSTQRLLDAISRLNQWPSCKCIIAISCKSNLLSRVLVGNSDIPVINCYPLTTSDQVWSPVNIPSSLSCTTIFGADNCAKAAAQIVANDNIYVWCKMRCQRTLAAIHTILEEEDKSETYNKFIHC